MPDKPPESRRPEPNRPDPLRREPPILDMKAKEVKPAAGSAAPVTTGGAGPKPDPARSTSPAAAAKPAESVSTARPASPAGVQAPAGLSASDGIPARRHPAMDLPGTSRESAPPPAAKPPGDVPKPASTPLTGTAVPPTGAAATKPKPASDEPVKAASASAAAPPKASAEPTARMASPPPPARARGGRGIGSLLASGLLGGLVGAGLVYGADHYYPGRGDTDLASRLARLEQRPTNVAPAGPAVDTGAIDRRLSAIETANRQLAEAAQRPVVSSTPAAAPGASEAMAARLSSVEDGVRQAGTATTALAEIRTQLAGLRTNLDDQVKQGGAAAQTNAAALSELGARVTALQSQAASQAAAGATAVGAMQARLGEGEKKLDALSGEFAKFGPAAAQAGLRVIVAGRLGDALAAGQPVGPLIATAQKIGAPDSVVDPLKVYATAAPPSAAALARDFEPLGRQMIEGARGPATSIGDRLLRMADRIVTVRDVGDTSGSDVPAQVRRVEAALARGALTEAVAAWTALPEGVRAPSVAWATQLKQREAAGSAARRLSTDALASIDSALR